jgi:CheY-like chemotaxis protein/anti-sigma regulatory factor (Ser/Thr protein kinase)
MEKREKHFLIVEDSLVDLHLIRKFLYKLGYRAITDVSSGEEALQKVETIKPDLVFMDIYLEGKMTGIETHAELVKKYDVPIIFTTGYADDDLINRVKDLTPYGYLIKPYDKNNLHVSIEIALKRYEFDKQLMQANREIDELNKDLQKHLDELNQANKKLVLSEERYRLLVEGSNEIIFSMDKNWKILTINKSIGSLLNISQEEVISRSLFDIIYRGNEENAVTRQLVQEKLEIFSQSTKPVTFKTMFRSSISSEPKELQVKLEHINIEGRDEIFGKAARVLEDSLMKFFISEQQKFIIESSLVAAEDISYRVTRNLVKYMKGRSVNLLRIALREIIINAVEHGNLGITFEEKSKAVTDGTYLDFLIERQKDPERMKKKIEIEYSVNPEKVVYKITDEGKGFDHKKVMEKSTDDVNRLLLGHGRGITMAKNTFDEIQFNSKGNQVFLIKNF